MVCAEMMEITRWENEGGQIGSPGAAGNKAHQDKGTAMEPRQAGQRDEEAGAIRQGYRRAVGQRLSTKLRPLRLPSTRAD